MHVLTSRIRDNLLQFPADATGAARTPPVGAPVARLNIANSRRQQIIDATIRVMAARGWKDTSIDEITREAGVSRGLLAYHFKDKSQLLAGVLARCQELFAAAVAETIASSDDPTEQLRNASRNAILMARDAPASYEVFLHFSAGARSDPELGAQVRDLYRGFRRAIAAGIRKGQASGHFRPLNPEAVATGHMGTIIGIALQWLLDPRAFDLDAAANDTADALIALVSREPVLTA